ncbi:MAG: aspartyl protease family protein [Vicinamibacterales bacterium]
MRHALVAAAVLAASIGTSLGVRAADPVSAVDAELQFQLGTLLSGDSRYYDAMDAFDRAARSPDRALAANALKWKVRTALLVAEWGTARRESERLMQALPGDPEAATLRADTLWSSGLFDEADAIYRDTLARTPGSSRARLGVARSLATRNQLDAALAEGLAASAAAPRDGEIHFQVGDIYERMNRFEEAANAYTNYINLLPNKDRSDRAAWSKTEVVFLKAFAGKTPVEITSDPDRSHTLPFKLVNEKVVVRARINGGRPRDLVLDTGAEETVISEETARRIGVRPITYTLSAGVGEVGLRGLQLGRLDTLELGTLTVKNVPVLIKTPGLGARIPKKETDSFSPMALGLSASIDYRNSVITMARDVPQEPADFALPMRIQRLALVRGLLNKSHPAYFVVDTGGQVISISSAVADGLQMKPVRRIPLKVFGMSGWDRDAFLLPGVDLAFDNLRYTNMPLVVLNLRTPSALLGFQIGGIVGHKFLAPYKVTMDLQRSELRLTKN